MQRVEPSEVLSGEHTNTLGRGKGVEAGAWWAVGCKTLGESQQSWHETARWLQEAATGEKTLRSPCRNWEFGSQRRMFLKQVVSMMFFQAHQTAHLLGQGEGTTMLSLHTEWEHSIMLNIGMSASNNMHHVCWSEECGLSANLHYQACFYLPQ